MSHKKTEFFVIVAPGTEAIAAQELEEVWGFLLASDLRPHTQSLPKIEKHFGGLSFSADLALGLQLHYWLKIPVRILVRLHSFFADEFYQLENGIQSCVLKNWLEKGTQVEFKIESQKSKLGQEKRVLEVVKKTLAQDLKIVDESPIKIYLRGSQNQWTLSLDATGEPLYKRAWAPLKGEAPLRENLASTCWRILSQDMNPSDLQKIHLYDPFAGSGTCLFEAALEYAPQEQRSFSFLTWKQTPSYLKLPQFLKNYKMRLGPVLKSITGADADPEMIKIAKENLRAIQSWESSLNILFQQKEFWNDGPLASSQGPTWVLTNPPFGQRIPWSNEQKRTWLKHLVKTTNADRIGFVYPQKLLPMIEFPENYDLLSKNEFLHGGQNVEFVVIQKK